jgi:hypothetical protein
MVLGMFLANSHPAIILFDFGASHSFISSKLVTKDNLPITLMNYTMLVSSSGGEMKTKHICLVISIAIRGGGGRLCVEPHHRRLQWHGLAEEV